MILRTRDHYSITCKIITSNRGPNTSPTFDQLEILTEQHNEREDTIHAGKNNSNLGLQSCRTWNELMFDCDVSRTFHFVS